METKIAIKTISQASKKNGKSIAKELNITPGAYTQYMNSQLQQIERLIRICEICDCQLQITNNNGMTITLDSGNKKTSKRWIKTTSWMGGLHRYSKELTPVNAPLHVFSKMQLEDYITDIQAIKKELSRKWELLL